MTVTAAGRGVTATTGETAEKTRERNDTGPGIARLPRVAAVVALALGLVALAGWVVGAPVLASLAPGGLTMKVNTALGAVFLALAMLALEDPRPAFRRLGAAVAGAVALLAAVTALQWVGGFDVGIDQLLVREPPGAVGTTVPGRMSPQTAIGFVALAAAMVLARRARESTRRTAAAAASAVCASVPLVLAALNFLDDLFGAEAPTFLAGYTQIARPTGIALAALALGAVAMLPGGGPLATIAGRSRTAAVTRRLLLAVLVIPVVLAWLRLEGERLGLYGTAFGVSLMTLTTIAFLLLVLWHSSRALGQAEKQREEALVALEYALAESRRAAEERERARSEAETANRAKNEFLSRMSHELRTPLNAVLGFAQLLEMDELTDVQREHAGYISRAGRHLLELIDEVLDIARIETGRLPISPEPVPVGELLGDMAAIIKPLATARGIELTITPERCDEHVMADRQRLKQVLLNLLSNAVKYNRDGGSVEVRCSAADGRLRISVRDTGPGIEPEKVSRLFTPFERLGAEYTSVEGTGIGLALSRRLVEAMGGSIDVETAVGEGTTFWFELPVVEGPLEAYERQRATAGAAEASAHPPRAVVLHIEDNVSNQRLVERILRLRPSVALIATAQGRLGMELAREHRPDLILLDAHLPDLSGRDVLRELRNAPETASIPVIVVSADATEGQIRRLKDAGAQGYLTKPLDVGAFLETVDGIIGDANAEGAGAAPRRAPAP